METATIYFLITLSLALAFGGTTYGFDIIYSKKFQEEFKEYEESIKNNLYFSIRELGLKAHDLPKYKDEIDEKIKKFMEDYQNYQDNIKGSYNRLMSDRNYFSKSFFLAFVSYTSFLIKSDLIILGTSISTLSNIFLIFGLIFLGLFFWQLTSLQNAIATNRLTKPSFTENVDYILNKVIKSRKRE